MDPFSELSRNISCETAIHHDRIESLFLDILNNKNGGLQSTEFTKAKTALQRLLSAKASSKNSTKVILAYTSNLISSGLREVFAHLARHKLVDAFVSTAGGVEEDIIKCLGETILGDFALPGNHLRQMGLNRVGNLLIPNNNYCSFEKFLTPVIEKLHSVQLRTGYMRGTSPSQFLYECGKGLDDEDSQQYIYSSAALAEDLDLIESERTKTKERSVVYWAAKNRIPIYCPALTDGSIGDMMCFYDFRQRGFMIDPVMDYGWLLPFGELESDEWDSKEEINQNAHKKHSEKTEAEEQEVLIICLGAGLPRNYALKMTPKSGTVMTCTDEVSPLPYESADEEHLPREKKSEAYRVKYRRTIIQVVTGTPADGCSSSVIKNDDLENGLVNDNDEWIRVHGDAALLFPLMMAGILNE
eukprot:Tbor_TRINITY_DN9943_c0_g1::TRINITY_DN9943_c0_g1_i1::g.17696::m.17696/K00809/DHPS, dys; deoxyhypusine synthase